MKNNTYTEDDIDILDDREHVRLRTGMFLGNTNETTYMIPIFEEDGSVAIQEVSFIPAVYKCLGEILENSIDELNQVEQEEKILHIEANPSLGTFEVTDNGRGVPIGLHKTGKHTPEIVFGSLRSGRNFNDANRTTGTIGMNGVGSAAVAMCSSSFRIDIKREGKQYIQTLTEGTLHRTKPHVEKYHSKKTGTSIQFVLDESVFNDITLPGILVRNRAKEIAATNPSFTVYYNKQKFKFKNGFEDLIKVSYKDYYCFKAECSEFYIIYSEEEKPEQVNMWVNSAPLFDGGIINTQFLNAFTDKLISHLSPQAKKSKSEIIKSDVRNGLIVFGSIKLNKPEYDSQAKTRLIGPSYRKEIDALLDEQWNLFTKKAKPLLDKILEKAINRHNEQATKKAIKDHKKTLNKKIPKLIDAVYKVRSDCMLLITEGDSAKSSITEVRGNNSRIGAFPLTGKINNVYGSSVAEVLKMGKVADLLSAINLTPGKPAHVADLRYGKIVITSDADVDGSHIFSLLVNLFYQFWPELFRPACPVIYRLIVPNVIAHKGDKRVHFTSLNEFEKVKSKYKGWTIDYIKGLGSMEKEDWKIILFDEKFLYPIIDDGKISDKLKLFFSDDTDARKEWLMKE